MNLKWEAVNVYILMCMLQILHFEFIFVKTQQINSPYCFWFKPWPSLAQHQTSCSMHIKNFLATKEHRGSRKGGKGDSLTVKTQHQLTNPRGCLQEQAFFAWHTGMSCGQCCWYNCPIPGSRSTRCHWELKGHSKKRSWTQGQTVAYLKAQNPPNTHMYDHIRDEIRIHAEVQARRSYRLICKASGQKLTHQ